MLKRTIVITEAYHLSLKNAQMVVSAREMPEMTRTVPIEDLGFLVIESQMATATIPLLNALVDNGVAVVLCDSKGMPHAFLENMDGHNMQGEILSLQVGVSEPLKKQLWKQIVECKIQNQENLLNKIHGNGDALKSYRMNVKSGDSDNREGAAAHAYFPLLFGDDFVRDRNLCGINALLNYGYTVLRAATTRALVSSGLTPALGLFHHNRSNAFPLADDMMEPFRPFVDEIVYALCEEGKMTLNKETKGALIGVLYCDTEYPKVTRPLQVGLSLTMASLAKCYRGEQKKLSLPELK